VSAEGEYATLHRLANDLHKSRLFKTGSVEQALAVILMGRELGIGPTTALSNIAIAAGKPTLGAALVGALIQKSGKYGYTVTEMSDTGVSVEFFEKLANYNGQGVRNLGTSTFTLQDAQRARLSQSQTWQQYPRNLLLARAITNGARWYCPEVFGGAIYDPDELGLAGVLSPPEGEAPDPTGSAPHASPSKGEAVDAEFVPNGEAWTIEGLLEVWSAEDILAANEGQLPGTDADVERVHQELVRRSDRAATAP
jgi:hypothetical protein